MVVVTIQFMKQKMMRKVFYALIPLILAGTYFYGLRVLILLTLVSSVAVCVEWIFVRKTTKKISEAIFITSILYTLTLPPRIPYWIALVGIIFGVLFGKMVFGGFGKNPFNPALVGRAFIYVSFPHFMTVEWANPIRETLGGFSTYSVDAISQATPLLLYRSTGTLLPYNTLLMGNVAGSIGETSAILILFAALYLLWTNTASKETTFSVLIGFLLTDAALYYAGFSQIPPPFYGLLAGGLLFGAVFMATDPISSPRTKEGKIVYGLLIGCIAVIIRGFALFAGGIMFAILIGNTFAPIIDEAVKYIKKQRRGRGESNA